MKIHLLVVEVELVLLVLVVEAVEAESECISQSRRHQCSLKSAVLLVDVELVDVVDAIYGRLSQFPFLHGYVLTC